jgi:hypothetical protein
VRLQRDEVVLISIPVATSALMMATRASAANPTDRPRPHVVAAGILVLLPIAILLELKPALLRIAHALSN